MARHLERDGRNSLAGLFSFMESEQLAGRRPMVLRPQSINNRIQRQGMFAGDDSEQLPQQLLDQLNDMWLKEMERPVKESTLAQLPRF